MTQNYAKKSTFLPWVKPCKVESHFEALSLMFRQRQEELIASLDEQFNKRFDEFDKIDQIDVKKVESFISQGRVCTTIQNFFFLSHTISGIEFFYSLTQISETLSVNYTDSLSLTNHSIER